METRKQKNIMIRTMQMSMLLLLAAFVIAFPQMSQAATAGKIDHKVDSALKTLYKTTPAAKNLAKVAKGILVFPDVVKGGVIVGGQYGEGALRVGGKTAGYYKTVAASYGLQAGGQSFAYVLFFLDNESLQYLKDSQGWEIGVGPSVVVVDTGVARTLTTTTIKSGVYAFIFRQKGLMAGLGIQGSQITEITPGK
jgi:lipid-binding SYLF domain-containing protein